MGNLMQTQFRNAADAKDAAVKIFKGIAPKLDTTRQQAQTEIEQLEASTEPPKPKDAASAVYAGECRAALSRMAREERANAINQAIAEGDDAFVSAAVTGNVALTRLGPAEAAALREAWKRKRHGPTLDRIARLRETLDEFNRISSLLSGFSLGILADQNAAVAAAQKSAELARAAMADVA